jgi:hypothetical protein
MGKSEWLSPYRKIQTNIICQSLSRDIVLILLLLRMVVVINLTRLNLVYWILREGRKQFDW